MFSLQTHIRGKGDKIVRVQNYMRLSNEGETVYLSNGQVHTENGTLASPLPSWLSGELAKADSKALAAVGFQNWNKPKRGRPVGSFKKAKVEPPAPNPTEPVGESELEGGDPVLGPTPAE